MSELATRQQTALVIQDDQQGFSPQQISALAQLGVENAAPGDLDVFFHQAKRTGLDPFAKQIYMIGRTKKVKDYQTNTWQETTQYTIQTGIDGYRLIARRAVEKARTDLFYEDAQWCGPDGVWTDVWLSRNPPLAAKVVVWRGGERFSAVALYMEYVQLKKDYKTGEMVPNTMWAKMPASQLSKCAEGLALRKAFPLDLSGIYTDEEMPAPEQVDGEEPVEPVTVQRRMVRTQAPEPSPEPEAVEDPEIIDESEPEQEPAPVEDAWTQQLPEPPQDEGDQPATVAERKQLGLHLQAVYASQEDAMQWVSEQMGRPVAKSAELTSDEVEVLIKELQR